mmetsp:Transcript_43283/g.122668  ORF Transcript_43283/g.122668 Transcript_43283/m.122668 type:complete len:243 (-) Transcript_43283:8-736(-)
MKSLCEVLGDALVAARVVAKGAPEVSRVRTGDDAHVAVRIENATGAGGVARGILDPAGEGALGVALAAVGCQLVAEAAPVLGRAGLLCDAGGPRQSGVGVPAEGSAVGVLIQNTLIALNHIALFGAIVVWLVAERLGALVVEMHEAVWALGEGVLSDGTDAMILGRCHGHITGRQESQHTRRDTALHHLVLVVADQEDGGRRIRDELAGIREAGTKGKAGTHKERSGSDELEDGWMDGWKDR